MEQSKNNIRQLITDSEAQELTPEILDKIKIEINTLCWTYLPPETTLTQSDAIAMTMWDMIINPKKYLAV
jgi:hypothetical protein